MDLLRGKARGAIAMATSLVVIDRDLDGSLGGCLNSDQNLEAQQTRPGMVYETSRRNLGVVQPKAYTFSEDLNTRTVSQTIGMLKFVQITPAVPLQMSSRDEKKITRLQIDLRKRPNTVNRRRSNNKRQQNFWLSQVSFRFVRDNTMSMTER